jgi:succinate dehydrogenase/fumarate reductase cytochrome b subunit
MNAKKTIYIILVIILGLILSFIFHAVIEIFYINHLLEKGIIPEPSSLTHQCYLPSSLQVILLLAGLFGGYFLGRFWWQKVYIERKRETK